MALELGSHPNYSQIQVSLGGKKEWNWCYILWREIIHKLSSKTPYKIEQPLLNTPFDELSVNKYLNSY